MPDGDRLRGEREARVQRCDRRIRPVGDRSAINAGERRRIERERAPAEVEVHDRGGGAHDDRELRETLLGKVALGNRDLGRGEGDPGVVETHEPADRAHRVIVDAGIVGDPVRALPRLPLDIDAIGRTVALVGGRGVLQDRIDEGGAGPGDASRLAAASGGEYDEAENDEYHGRDDDAAKQSRPPFRDHGNIV